MTDIFLKVLNMSYSAGWLILAILLLRLLLKKAPKWVNVLLWGIAAVRLIFPFSLESIFSLTPSRELVSPDIMLDPAPTIQSGIPAVNDVVNPIIQQSFAPNPGTSMNPLQLWLPLAAAVWVLGILVMLGYTLISYWKLQSRVDTAVRLCSNIFRSEAIPSPFVLGLFRPRIYLPAGISEADMAHVIAHEEAHIRRRDHWWKPLGFLLLSIHWFNPLLWLGYVLLCRDIELACDEKVINELGEDIKADYSQALLNCSVNRKHIAACPLAFGEVGVKQRIKSVLHYKKPAFWILIAAIVICCVVAVCFLTDPVTPEQDSIVCLFDEDAGWDITVGSQVPGKTDITVQVDRHSAGITHPDGTVTTVLSGMPIRNAYFCDLNGDGVSELCAGISIGSGIVDDRICVYDFANTELHMLESRTNYDYHLSCENSVLMVTVYPYMTKNIEAKGPLVLEKRSGEYRLTYRETVPDNHGTSGWPGYSGIKSIQLSDSGKLTLEYYHLSGGYSVEMVPKDAQEYCGDGMIPYDGALGAYRMMITFGDTDPTDSLRDLFPAGQVCTLKHESADFGTVKAKLVYPSDHGFVLYVGSDTPFTVTPESKQDMDHLLGSLSIQLTAAYVPPEATKIVYRTAEYDGASFQVPGKPDTILHIDSQSASIVNPEGSLNCLFSGAPLGIAYFCDLNQDGIPELCASASLSYNLNFHGIYVYDFANAKLHKLNEAGKYNYYLTVDDPTTSTSKLGAVVCLYYTDEAVKDGYLSLTPKADGSYALELREKPNLS